MGMCRLQTLAQMPEIGRALLAPDAVREAASRQVRSATWRADTEDEDGPLWHGWALHAAFIAGVLWALHETGQKEG